ncbi:LemA family protein [Rubrivirga sp. IMCC45206]|uniref:LemA family protein n=1 Tax=Rubrivirga sp. IMCC45206 TaxID=3391614 RepID=UPI00398FDC6D
MRSTGAIALLVIVLLVGFAGCAGCGSYNSLVQQDEQVERAWADVETQYQRRADFVQQAVAVVQGQADFESETLQEVIEARSRATSIQISADDLDDPAALQRYQEAQAALGSSFGRLLAVSERYPTLQANEGFLNLQSQIEGTENRIATARRDYNQAVADLNGRIRTFPTNLVAGFAGVDRRAPFESQAGAEEAPTITFD